MGKKMKQKMGMKMNNFERNMVNPRNGNYDWVIMDLKKYVLYLPMLSHCEQKC